MNDESPKRQLVRTKPPSVVEKVAGSRATGLAATAISVVAGDFAGMLPSLIDCLARTRQTQRVEQSMRDLEAGLNELHELVLHITDDQYKVVAEVAAAMYSTVDADKLKTLRVAALQAVRQPAAVDGASDAVGRALRDLSVAEVRFLIKYQASSGISIGQEEGQEQGRNTIKGGSDEEVAMTGLISLGLLVARATTWDAQIFEWATIIPRLLLLLVDEK